MSASAPTAPIDGAQEILCKYDINGKYLQMLYKLKGFKVVLICDDSTSMRETLTKGQSKWDELRHAVQIVIDILNALKIECDVLFLNREGVRNAVSFQQLEAHFASPPYGATPLKQCFDMALSFNKNELTERKLNVVILTDGCPTSQGLDDKSAIKEFKHALKDRQPINKIFITIVACTDDEYALEYLDNWDRSIKYLDVVDDYESEKKQIYKARSKHEAFSYGDYIAKIVIGPSNKEIDQADEAKAGCNLL